MLICDLMKAEEHEGEKPGVGSGMQFRPVVRQLSEEKILERGDRSFSGRGNRGAVVPYRGQVCFILGPERKQVGLELYGKVICQEVTEAGRNQVIQALVSHGKGFNFYGKCYWHL